MSELSPVAAEAHEIKSRAISGIKVLTLRTFVSILLRVISSLVLARLLFPKDYGVFGVVSFIAGLGMYLCDVGLASALVRQEAKPTRNEAFTVFLTQQIITGLVVFTLIVTAPLLIHMYALSSSAATILYAMALGLFFSSLRIVPMMALERDLQFPVIARCELIENVVQTGSTILFAFLGWGPWALAGGGLLRGVVGLGLVWAASPWHPVGRFEFAIVKRLAKFGIASQLNAIMPSLFGGWMPLVVGRFLGVAAVGLVGWAGNIASVPMMLSGILNRVAFPAYSRLQSDPVALGHYLEISIRRVSAIFSLMIPAVVIVCPVAVPALFASRWIPAVPLVQWFSLECAVLTLTGLLAAAQSATGYPAERLAVTVVVGASRWGLGYIAVLRFGLMGIGPIMFVISFVEMCVTAWLVRRRNVGYARLMQVTFQPILIVGIMLAIAIYSSRVVVHSQGLTQTAVALLIFTLQIILREVITGGKILNKELCAVYTMLRPVRSETF